jgi:hypothetical protein
MPDDKKSYDVGYGKPPVHTRFQKGQSGNRIGRPKKEAQLPSLDAGIVEALSERVTITENGQVRQITKHAAALKQLANKAASGHMPTIKLLMPILLRQSAATGAAAGADSSARTLADVRARITAKLDALAAARQAELSNEEGASNKAPSDK